MMLPFDVYIMNMPSLPTGMSNTFPLRPGRPTSAGKLMLFVATPSTIVRLGTLRVLP